ncbi:MAG TPA: signal peptidase I [Stellaceae bacterium]|nr:signal peptidase I [Stellaceae bacterium]
MRVKSTAATPPRRQPAERKSGGIGDMLKTVVLALLATFFIRTVAAEPYSVPSGSMLPTLLIGDTLIASKFAYGYSRYSLAVGVPDINGRLFATPPRRGDVIVFRLPRDPSITYVKRVIGLPGDRIAMREGRLVLNGEVVPRRFVRQTEIDFGGRTLPVMEYAETLPDGPTHAILKLSDDQRLDNLPEVTVPAGHYFMMGDNRDDSLDSRVDPASGGVGFVPFDNLVGRADVLLFSRAETSWWDIWRLPASYRGDRFLKALR